MAYKLLLADDSITIQKVVELTLAEEGFEVTAVGDGESGLESARADRPDIILADVFMPRMDGYDLCQKIKTDPALRDIPVILLAGTFEIFDEERARSVRADDHLTKPFESAELINKVRYLAENRATAPAATLEAEPLDEVLAAEEAEPMDEAVFAEEPAAASGPDDFNDLWNVVDMASDAQPLAGATVTLTEEELWRRANLISSPSQPSPPLAEDGGTALDEIEAEAVPADFEEDDLMAAEEAVEFAEAEQAADIFSAEVVEYGRPEEVGAGFSYAPDPFPEVSVFDEEEGPGGLDAAAAFESASGGFDAVDVYDEPEVGEPALYDDAVEAPGEGPFWAAEEREEGPAEMALESPAPSFQAAPPVVEQAAGVQAEAIREQVSKIARQSIESRLREELSTISREMIEKIVWEVVPDLAEEIITREIEKLRTGTK